MAKHKMSKESQIKGCRKALANPRTPKQFLPGLKKRLAKLTGSAAIALALFGCAARPARAQFIGYTTPQSVQQTLANGVTCTGSPQIFTIQNLGQNVHQVYVTPSGSTSFTAVLQGIDTLGQVATISDTAFPAGLSGAQVLTAASYYPVLQLNVQCPAGTFKATYSGSSSYEPIANAAQAATAFSKNIASGASAGTSLSGSFFTPAGNLGGVIEFAYAGAGPANSTVTVSCSQTAMVTGSWAFNLATTAGVTQLFPVPNLACPSALVQYTAGGASASTFQLSYLLSPSASGLAPSASAANLSAALNMAPTISERGSRWSVFNAPGAGSQAVATKAAGGPGVRHVADCVTISAGAVIAPAATTLNVFISDAGTTTIWSTQITAGNTATQHGNFAQCGLNLIGSPNSTMLLEFGAGLTNESESVELTGYDVQ